MFSKSFSGFPEKMEITPIPTLFLTALMPYIEDIAELKTVLHIFRLLSRRRGYPRFVTMTELLHDNVLVKGISGGSSGSTDTAIRHSLEMAVKHGILLQLQLDKENNSEYIYFINTNTEKENIDKIQRGELLLSGLKPVKQDAGQISELPNIFSLYEQNIGILTPMIAEELQEAEKRYPADWIEAAFKESVALNKRNWKYIARILERWAVEGKDYGKIGRDIKKEKDPDKYIRGKYGHMVKR